MSLKQPAMILFGGYSIAKYPAVAETIQQYGCKILAIDEFNEKINKFFQQRNNNVYHPFQLIHDFYHANNADTDKIFARITAWSKAYEIKGVYTIKEIFVKPAGYVADYLRLPFPGLRAIEVCRNKHYQRAFLQDWSPSYQLITPVDRGSVDLETLQYPFVIKPISRHSSSGVRLINDQYELKNTLNTYSADEDILLEEIIVGNEYSVETLIQNREILFASVTQKRTNSNGTNYFVEMAHTVPDNSLSSKIKSELLKINSDIIHQLKFENGISHAEYKITDSGNIYLMEIAARSPGDAIMALYQLATDELLEKQAIRIALGMTETAPNFKRCARQVYLQHMNGILKDVVISSSSKIAPTWFAETFNSSPTVSNHTIEELSGLHKILVLKERGSRLTEITSSDDRCVTYLISSGSYEQLNQLESILAEKIKVIVE